jgi:hypothetical protein
MYALLGHSMFSFSFHMVFFFFGVLCIELGLLHFLSFTLIQCICGQLLYPMGTYLFFFFVVVLMVEKLFFMTWFRMFLHSLWEEMRGFMFCVNKFMSFHCFPFKLLVDELTLCYLLMAHTFWSMLSLLITKWLPKTTVAFGKWVMF